MTQTKKAKHGGRRKNSGRKPVEDKKVALTIWPRMSQVEKLGGMEVAKSLVLQGLEGAVKKLEKK